MPGSQNHRFLQLRGEPGYCEEVGRRDSKEKGSGGRSGGRCRQYRDATRSCVGRTSQEVCIMCGGQSGRRSPRFTVVCGCLASDFRAHTIKVCCRYTIWTTRSPSYLIAKIHINFHGSIEVIPYDVCITLSRSVSLSNRSLRAGRGVSSFRVCSGLNQPEGVMSVVRVVRAGKAHKSYMRT